MNELEAKPQIWPLAEQTRQATPLRPIAPEGYPNPSQGLQINLATIWHVLWLWRWLVLGAAAAGLAGGLVVALMTTPLYRSTATLELNPPTVQVTERDNATDQAQNDHEFLQTQWGLLRSRALAERVAEELNLAGAGGSGPDGASREARQAQAVGMLVGGLKVDPDERSRLVEISFSSPDPELAARAVNGFAESFIESGLRRRYESSSYARTFLERQIGIVRRELENSERQLAAYAQQQGIITTAGGGGGTPGAASPSAEASSPTAQSLSQMNAALAQATARRIAAEQKYRQAGGGTASEVSERTSVLRQQLALLQSEYQEKLALFQPDYPEMVQRRQRIESLQQSIASEASNVRGGRVATLQAEYQASLAEEQAIQARVQGLTGAMINLRGRSIQYNILQREVDTNRTLYDGLLQRYKDIGVAGAIGTSQASIVDRGQVPTAPYKPNLMLNLVIGLFIGMAAGIAIAFILEFLNDTIKTPDDVRDKLRLAFLGGVPAAPKGANVIEELKEGSSTVSEAYFSATTALQFTTETGAPKVLALTSTRPAEGKSTTAWGLATSFARLGRNVLLIDADMRKPAFVTGAEKKDGLALLLTNRDSLMTHVVKAEENGVALLPCGPLPPNPAELLASSRFDAILAEAEANFDIVIVDGPPILGLADTPLIASRANGTLMVVEAGRTRTRAAGEAVARLTHAGANVLGALLTRYKPETAGYGYGYGGYSPYKYESLKGRDREIRLIVKRNG